MGLALLGESDRLRFRLHPRRTTHRAHGERPAHDAGDGTARGTFLQLVRHAVAEAAAASLRLVGGQRQSRRPSDDACGRGSPRLPTTGSSSAMVRGLERHAADARRRRRRSRSGAARAPAAGSGNRLRFPARRPSRRRDSGSTGSTRASPRSPHTSPASRAPIPPSAPRRRAKRHSGRTRSSASAGAMQDELAFLAPWSALPAAPSGLRRPPGPRATSRRCASLPRSKCELLPAIERRQRADASPADRAWLDELVRVADRSESSRRRADRGDRAAGAAVRRAGAHGVRLSLRRRASPAGHRLQRRRAPARPELLRSARFGSEVRQFRGDCAGTVAAGELVRARAPAHDRGGPIGAAVLERLDVRVPDAAAGDADVRQHAARPDLSRVGGAADRVRQAARRAVGHLGMRLQLGRCQPQLPVPRLRRARPGVEARTGRGSGHRSLRVGARADGGARGVVPQPAAARGRRTRRKIRPLRGHRLHACAPAARADRAPSCVRSWRITRA